MSEEISVVFRLKNGKWHFQVSQNKYAYAAAALTLEDAESKAYQYINKLKSTGTIHTTYIPGKHVYRSDLTWEEEGRMLGYFVLDENPFSSVE